MYRPIPVFAAATGLRPEEWAALERRDVDRRGRMLNVRRTISGGEIVELGKTSGAAAKSRCPARARGARRAPARGWTRRGCSRHHAAGCCARQLPPARVGAGDRGGRYPPPARIYDLRATFISDALAAGVSVFELARIMGTSVA